ncbi:MAG: hypothetical protein ACE15F_20250 [bacterium]
MRAKAVFFVRFIRFLNPGKEDRDLAWGALPGILLPGYAHTIPLRLFAGGAGTPFLGILHIFWIPAFAGMTSCRLDGFRKEGWLPERGIHTRKAGNKAKKEGLKINHQGEDGEEGIMAGAVLGGRPRPGGEGILLFRQPRPKRMNLKNLFHPITCAIRLRLSSQIAYS